jgi:hypothetical protein
MRFPFRTQVCAFLFTLVFAAAVADATRSDMTIRRIRCDGFDNPTGVGSKPAFSWILQSKRRDQKQTAYQIRVASRLEDLGPVDRV